jgi:hypothetical protein
MNEKSGTFELLEPNKPEALVPDSPVEAWMIVVAALLVVLVALILIFKKKKVRPVDPRALRRAAFTEASTALEEIGPVPAREAAVQASLILRRYLSIVAGDPALFETHEETVSRHDALKDFSEEARGSAGLGFSRLAAIKYAPVPADMEAPEVIAGSHRLLATLHQGFHA